MPRVMLNMNANQNLSYQQAQHDNLIDLQTPLQFELRNLFFTSPSHEETNSFSILNTLHNNST
jgi:hypothetical protein